MARKEISTQWDRDNRNAMNDNFKQLFDGFIDAGHDATEAIQKATEALDKSNQALDKSDSTQKQLNDIIIESGTSDAEVIQARGNHDVLGDRLNSIDQVLAQTTNEITDIHQNKASKEELYLEVNAKANRSYVDTKVQTVDGRIDDIITSPAQGVSEQEIIDSREGEASLGANVRNIRGKAEINFKNENKNGNFTKGLDGWFTQFGNVEVDGDIANLIGGSGRSGTRIYNTLNETPTNEIWYATANARTLTDGANWFSVQFRGATGATDARINNPVTGQWYSFSHYATPSDFSGLTGTFGFAISSYWNVGIDDKHVQVSELMAFNLTEIFGSGNEPTQEEMDALVDFFGYFEGDLGAGKFSRFLSENQRLIETDIKEVKTYKDSELEDIITNGDFINSRNYWTFFEGASLEHIPGWARLSGTGSTNMPAMLQTIDVEYNIGDILYVAGDFRPQNDDVVQLGFAIYSDVSTEADIAYLTVTGFNTNGIVKVSGNVSVASDDGNMRVQVRTRYPSAVESNGKSVDITSIKIYNLTRFFGKGNEPSAESFERMLSIMITQPTENKKTELSKTQTALTQHILDRINIMAGQPARRPLCLIEFDDGNMTDYTMAFPFLRARGIRATVNITIELLNLVNYMGWEQLHELKNAGWGVEGHTYSNSTLVNLTDEEIRQEMAMSNDAFLTNGFGKPRHETLVGGVAWNDERVKNIVSEYRRSIRNSRGYVTATYNTYDSIDFKNLTGLPMDIRDDTMDRIDGIKSIIKDAANNNGIIIPYAHRFVESNAGSGEGYFEPWADLVDYIIDKDFEFVTRDELYIRLQNR